MPERRGTEVPPSAVTEEEGEHDVLLLVGGLPHRPSTGLLRHVTFTVQLGLGEV
jgi:hypothetical protein